MLREAAGHGGGTGRAGLFGGRRPRRQGGCDPSRARARGRHWRRPGTACRVASISSRSTSPPMRGHLMKKALVAALLALGLVFVAVAGASGGDKGGKILG